MTQRPPCKGKARVIIIDDHPVVRRGLAQLIDQESDLQVCGEAGSAHAAIKVIEELAPDILILDLSLGDSNGIPMIKDVRARFGDLPILVLSMHDESLYAERVLRVGAQGYIMKEKATEKVIEAIRHVLRGEIYLSPKMSTRLVQKMVNGDCPEGGSVIACLSNRELEVFELIGRGMGTRTIAGELGVSIKTIEAHRENIKRKLKLGNAIELLQFATQWVEKAE